MPDITSLMNSWTLAQKVVGMVIAAILCLSVALSLIIGLALNRYAEHLGVDRQAANMRVAWDVLHSYGTEFHAADGKLYAGQQVLNGFFAPVDRIQALVGGTATIFMGDERIATNVKKPDGSRAIGTKLAPGPVYERTLRQGLAFRGEAQILGETYFTAYEPIRDASGAVIGVLYVGIPKAEFYSTVNALLRQCAFVTLLVVALAIVACLYAARRMFRPLDALRVSAEHLSRGDMSADIGFADRGDDLGKLAQVLVKLRETSRQKAEMEAANAQIEAGKSQMEAANAVQRRAREAQERSELESRVAAASATRRTVDALATGLDHLSAGDLCYRIETPFHDQYEKLRSDFNAAMQTLSETLGAIKEGADSMRAGTASIRAGTSELSGRTQMQATRLESTKAALSSVSHRIHETANAAAMTRTTVDAARNEAEKSAVVVRKAIAAMSQIEDSSKQIQQIIGVIDAIAFQTNLLALNAAVEAARAGDQGRGFAVVAAEVRNLASRSSDAAKQVKMLILRSSEQVEGGTALVGATGEALERIVGQVNEINGMVREIDVNAVSQADEVRAVDGALAELDILTRQNTAMVEESTAATETLANDAVELMERIQRFRLEIEEPAAIPEIRRRA